MMLSETVRYRLLNAMHPIKVVAGILLLAAFSWEILIGPDHHLSAGYLRIQFDVCLLFLLDFVLQCTLSKRPLRYLRHHLLYLFCAVPWLNLMAWSGIALPRSWSLIVGLPPVLLPALAVYFLIKWIDEIRIHRLLVTYAVAALLFTYLAALIFFEVETGTNADLHSFGDALWWAGVNLTTAGASIIPTTAVGKLLSVLLPLAGMLFLPIFTSYIMQRYDHRKRR